MRLLVVNADDFGQTRGVSAGIVHAHREGIVTSTTLMANGAAFEEAVGLARANPGLGVGVHLNLVEGRPLCDAARVPSLLDRRGTFLSYRGLLRRHVSGRLNQCELRREIEAQIDRVCEAGIEPTHVDAHKNVHVYPALFPTIAAAAESRGIRGIRMPYESPRWRDCLRSPAAAVRMAMLNAATSVSQRHLGRTRLVAPAVFGGVLRTGTIDSVWLVDWVRRLPLGSAELMVHPGWCDEELSATRTRLLASREAELRALVDPRVKAAIAEMEIELVHYRGLIQRLGSSSPESTASSLEPARRE